jgi:hypothetical protein
MQKCKLNGGIRRSSDKDIRKRYDRDYIIQFLTLTLNAEVKYRHWERTENVQMQHARNLSDSETN